MSNTRKVVKEASPTRSRTRSVKPAENIEKRQGIEKRLPVEGKQSAEKKQPVSPKKERAPRKESVSPVKRAAVEATLKSSRRTNKANHDSSRQTQSVFLFVPNLIGYLRVVLAIAAFYYIRQPLLFLPLYAGSCLLDALDGTAARALGQGKSLCSRESIWGRFGHGHG